jgi:hypothetical protein
MLSILEQLPVEIPVLFQERVQHLVMERYKGVKFFVMPPVMDPAQGKLLSDQFELWRVITKE